MYHYHCMTRGLFLFLTIVGVLGISVSANVIEKTSMKSHNDHAGGTIEDMKSHRNVNESHGNFDYISYYSLKV